MSTGLVGPLLFTLTFARFIEPARAWQVPGAPFLLSSSLTLVALAIAWPLTSHPVAPPA